MYHKKGAEHILSCVLNALVDTDIQIMPDLNHHYQFDEYKKDISFVFVDSSIKFEW